MKLFLFFLILFTSFVKADYQEVWTKDYYNSNTFHKDIEKIEISPDGEYGLILFDISDLSATINPPVKINVFDPSNGDTLGFIGKDRDFREMSNVSYDNKYVVVVEEDHEVNVWDIASQTITKRLNDLLYNSEESASFSGLCRFSGNSNKLVVQVTEGRVPNILYEQLLIIDCDNWTKIDSLEVDERSEILEMKFLNNSDSLSIQTDFYDSVVYNIIDINSGNEVWRYRRLTHSKYLYDFTSDNSYMIYWSGGLISIEKIKESSIFDLPLYLNYRTDPYFAIDGNDMFIKGEESDTIVKYNLLTNEITDTIPTHKYPIYFFNDILLTTDNYFITVYDEVSSVIEYDNHDNQNLTVTNSFDIKDKGLSGSVEVSIYSIDGSLIERKKVRVNNNTLHYETGHLQTGVYNVIIESETTLSLKILKD